MPKIFVEIAETPLASAGFLLVVCSILVYVSPELIRQLPSFRAIHHLYDTLEGRRVNSRFNGELLTMAGRNNEASLIALFWVCHTLRHLKDHVFDNATDIFSVVIFVQICVLIGAAGEAHDLAEWVKFGAEHVPGYEVAALVIFNYVVLRMGAYWQPVKHHFQGAMIKSLMNGSTHE